MSSTLTAESKKYAAVAKDLHRQVQLLPSCNHRVLMWQHHMHATCGLGVCNLMTVASVNCMPEHGLPGRHMQ